MQATDNTPLLDEQFKRIERMAVSYADAEFAKRWERGTAGSWSVLYKQYLIRLIAAHMEAEHYRKGYTDGLIDGAHKMREAAASIVDPDPWMEIMGEPFRKKAADIRALKVDA